MTQKVVRVGNSAAVTIPKQFLIQANINIGDEVEVESDKDLQLVQIKPKGSKLQTKITPEFKNWLDGFMDENESVLRELAQS